MTAWKKPEFVEVRMDAEINCYSSAMPVLSQSRAIQDPVPSSESNHKPE
jgi:coenzyme PQQ precursor peptide PqqA